MIHHSIALHLTEADTAVLPVLWGAMEVREEGAVQIAVAQVNPQETAPVVKDITEE